MRSLHKKFSKMIAGLLAVVMLVTTAFSITSEAAYGESHAAQFSNCTIYRGIDVSEHNGTIDWAQVKASGITFAIIRVGGRGWGSGSFYNDSNMVQNIQGARAAGIKVGVYFFSQAISEFEAAQEAIYTINRLKQYNLTIDLPIAMDFEYASDSSYGGRMKAANLSREQATAVCNAFCNTVTANGYKAMLYANKTMLSDSLNASQIANKYTIWLAQYRSSATYTGAYNYWQYSSSGSVPGISGRVDLDYYYSMDGSFSSSAPNIPVPTSLSAPDTAKVVYATHIQTYGWETTAKYDGATSGTTNQAKRLEAIRIYNNTDVEGSIEYRAYCQTYGWLDWVSDGDIAGLTGMAKRLEAIQIKLTGQLAETYDVYYRVHCQTYGWLDWAKNGEMAGTMNYAKRMEAIEIKLVEKGGAAPGATSSTYRSPSLAYNTHCQTFGWTGTAYDGATGGTTGFGKRMEAITITQNTKYSGSVVYRVHGQTYGWQGWRQDGQQAGSTGSAKRLEAIQIKLTGELAEQYDIYYRVHCQTYGWLGWAKNGEPAGTAGLGKRMEAIQIVLVSKNGAAPGSTARAYIGSAVPD